MAQTEISTFLRSRRARVQPSDLGLPPGTGTRRTAGLRREEVAAIAGVSVDYYTRLEQGRERNPSEAVLEALARTLRLSTEEREHLFRLAAHVGNPGRARATSAPTRQVRPAVRQLLDTVGPSPAYVLSRTNDLLASNPAGIALLAGIDQWPTSRRNTIRYIFLHPTARTLFVNWNTIAYDAVAHLRAMAGIAPNDSELAGLIEELNTKSEEFPRIWRLHDVRRLSTGRKLFDHPKVGRMELNYEVLDISRAQQRLVVYQAEPGTPNDDAVQLLNMLGSPTTKAASAAAPSNDTHSDRTTRS
ncbi:helix-turn-helix transcriptional regulator [Prescottella agglutinans]|uniref:Transcriptional regulator with XRE-family HTH domain n=1 Tax=Prescottella agglutinans TaxID=1644129 RepID=A0ABT6M6C5_9NOCA|nr:helix-turn-helix transcriptional regulator [Prescottella agglutinans]MDH6279866.1 transcriptional regulator with XRE-family HTH domain [Prescottella agglutinans]